MTISAFSVLQVLVTGYFCKLMYRASRLTGGISGIVLLSSGAFHAYNKKSQPRPLTSSPTGTSALHHHKMTVNNKFEVCRLRVEARS